MVHGKVSKLADPNAASSTSINSIPSVQDRIETLEKLAAIQKLEGLDESDYSRMVAEISTFLMNLSDTPWSKLAQEMDENNKKNIRSEMEALMALPDFQQLIIHHMQTRIMALASSAATTAVDAHIKTEQFQTALNDIIAVIIKALPLMEIEQERIKKQVSEFLLLRWLHIQQQMMERQGNNHAIPTTQLSPATLQNKEPVVLVNTGKNINAGNKTNTSHEDKAKDTAQSKDTVAEEDPQRTRAAIEAENHEQLLAEAKKKA